ncbi:MAG: outer membrane protein transport protein [Phycisphaerae bacterium]
MSANRTFYLTTAIFFFAFSLSALASDSWESIGVSTQSLGRGGADVAVGDSALSQVQNPATLSLSPRNYGLVDLGGQILLPTVTWSTPQDSSTSRSINTFGNFALTAPINPRLTLGLALYSKAGAKTDYHIRHLLIPYKSQHVFGDFENGAFLFNAAYKLTDKLSLGAGLRIEELSGKFNAVFGPSDLNIHRVWAFGGGYQLGLHYQATKKLTFGLGYLSPSWMNNTRDGQIDLTVPRAGLLNLGNGNLSNWQLPQKINLGSAYDLTAWWKLIGETRWINFRHSFLNETTLDVPDFFNIRFPFDLKFNDLWVFIIGSEFKLSDRWKLDVGYNYTTNPVSNDRMFPLAPTPIQHHISMGLRYEKSNWWVGGGYIYGFKNSQSAPGISKILFGNDYGLGTIASQQHSLFFGVGFHW